MRRKKYDSTLDFNDFIPEDKEYGAEEFFEVFGPVFQRNAHYSKITPVPEFGDIKTKMKKITKFYDFW